jgi:gamma-polyglutamate biosynthesis protein CapA
MTDAALPPPSHRGRLQRLMRRHATHAGRDSLLGLSVAALILALAPLLGAAEAPDPAVADDGDAVFTAALVGDLMLARHIEAVTDRRGHDALFEHVTPLLQADYVAGNLEQVVAADPDALPEADKLIHLAGGPEAVAAIAEAGFTTLALANNHTMDHGIPGLRETIAAVEEAGLRHAGAGEDLEAALEIDYQDHGDLTVATLSFTDAFVVGFPARAFQGGVLSAEEGRASRLIAEADANADLVIAHFHWGEEYGFAPNRTQRELAEMAAASGADLVVGHHPHVLQRVDRIEDTLVLYSLGNFVFDQGWTRTRESAVARYSLGGDGQARLELTPVLVREGAPRPLSGPMAPYHRARIFQRLSGDTLEWTRTDGRLITTIDHSEVLGGDSGSGDAETSP